MYHQKAIDPNPLNIILVKSDSKGDRLLFRYPYAADTRPESRQHNRRKNPYSLTVTEDLLQSPPPQTSNISKGHLTGFTDEVLSTLFAVKAELCEKKFELKVNDVRFVGHPTLLSPTLLGGAGEGSVLQIHLVFALCATASHSVVKCYHDLSQRLGVALRHEERRCGYLSRETKAMVTAHDEMAARPEDHAKEDADSPFDLILRRSALARDMRSVYEDLCSTGLVHVRVNKWIEVSFCLPQKVHQMTGLRTHKDFIVEPEMINKCLASLRPYHGLLLLVEAHELLDALPPDASPALARLIRCCSPLKSLQTLAADADLTLAQVFQLTGHLVYWARATVIYPLCESNVYVIAPGAIDAHLAERFSEHFPGMNLLQVMAEFSLPSSVAQRASPLGPPQQRQALAQAVVWMLRHRLLLHLHTYVNCFPTPSGPPRRHAASSRHSLAGGGGDAASLHSTPDEQLSLSAGGAGCGRAASESDLSSTLSDEAPPVQPQPPVRAHPPMHPHINSSSDYAGYYGYGSDGSNAVEAGLAGSALLLQEELLQGFSEEERAAVLRVPAAAYLDDLQMLVRLYRRGYLDGRHHLEEIMYLENLRRSTLLQLLDKFRDILITHETEDPAIAMFYPHSHT